MAMQDAAARGAAANENSLDQDTLGLNDLAQAVLDRRIRPRVGSVRRLAEAVLANAAEDAAPPAPAKKKKKTAKADAGKKGGAKKSGAKKRKQAKIPGQKQP